MRSTIRALEETHVWNSGNFQWRRPGSIHAYIIVTGLLERRLPGRLFS